VGEKESERKKKKQYYLHTFKPRDVGRVAPLAWKELVRAIVIETFKFGSSCLQFEVARHLRAHAHGPRRIDTKDDDVVVS
jgi:hypothetical protein